MKNWLKMIFFAVVVFLMAVDGWSAEVKNEHASQVGNRVVFEYDLIGDKETDVTVSVTIDGKKYTEKELHLEGDYGRVKPGKNKKVYWNALQDFPRGLHGDLEASIDAGAPEIPGMVFVKGGCFDMGDTFGDGESDEKPVHKVCLADFYIGKYEVTQKKWNEVMGSNPSNFKNCADCPVEQVSWNDVQGYIDKLNKQMGGKYRLPTEAEWEYAARSGGKKEKWAGTSNESELGEFAWSDQNSGSKTHPVGQKRPNGLGLYDMSGNVWEWVADWYGSGYYGNSTEDNPKGPSSGSRRVFRGGGWGDGARYVRSASRNRYSPDLRYDFIGFRLVRTR